MINSNFHFQEMIIYTYLYMYIIYHNYFTYDLVNMLWKHLLKFSWFVSVTLGESISILDWNKLWTLSHFYTKYEKKIDFSENLQITSLMCTLMIYKIMSAFNPEVFDEFLRRLESMWAYLSSCPRSPHVFMTL